MAETDWEKTIDKMVDENTKVYFRVYSNEGAPGIAGDTLVRNHDYYMIFYVYNSGTQVTFSKLQARVTLKGISNVVLYTDNTYSTPTNRIHLNWTDVQGGEWRQEKVYFRVTKDMKDANIVHYGIYGVVLPEGHTWDTLNWNRDMGPQ